jgi:5-methylcytosine-specific restriction enzyme subunit McrC
MRRHDNAPTLAVELSEWSQIGPDEDRRLEGLSLAHDVSASRLAEALRGRVDVREARRGLEITSTSFVGRVDVGPLRIAIGPKLPAMPLARLLRYAYGLRDVMSMEETRVPTTRHGLHDLLIAMLAAEIEEVLHRGLARLYIPLSETLESPRGRILVEKLICRGGVTEARLPCRYFERHTDWHLNQVLRAGLDAAAWMTSDRDLRRRVRRVAEMFEGVGRKARLDVGQIEQAEQGLTRLTAANAPALTIIRLLQDMLGVAFEPSDQSSRMPGFLFDMNRFFQRLLSRFLHDNLAGQRIEDEWAIRKLFAYALDANPKRRTAPSPRPDYALFYADTLRGFLDGKYRDIWEGGLPTEWLYQLSIYALASPARVSVLLYATMSAEARDERVDIRQPVPWSSKGSASVILRPVPLQYLAQLLDRDRAGNLLAERRRWAEELVDLQTHKAARVRTSGSLVPTPAAASFV